MLLSFLKTSVCALLSGLLLIPFILVASLGIYKFLLSLKKWNEAGKLDLTPGKIGNFFSFVVLLMLNIMHFSSSFYFFFWAFIVFLIFFL